MTGGKIKIVRLRPIFLIFATVALCVAQSGWQTATQLPAVDFSNLTKAQKVIALEVLRSESCACGCDMKLAECRVGDPKCNVSRRLSEFVVKEAGSGKSVAAIKESLKKFASAPEMLMEDKPVTISTSGDPVRGPAEAKVTIVEFSDFQCPFCAKAVAETQQVLAKYPKGVKLIFKQYPLDSHSEAELAAEAALAAQAQGKFWEMHDKMYANFRTINRARIFVWATQIGLDTNKLKADLDSHKYAQRVAMEEKQGDDAGVEGTPTFFINGKRLNAGFDVQTVTPLIEQELRR
jgi:protein-disulfide isomerase